MPLEAGASKGIVSANIREMVASGHPQRQAVAAALHNADKYRRAQGGIVPHYDDGGTVTTGFLHSNIPGRTDLIHASPPSGSYIVPADVVSGIGEGNSNAGAELLWKALNTGPYSPPKIGRAGGMHIPAPPPRYSGPLLAPPALKGGGDVGNEGQPTPILAAGGEFIIDPATVRAFGGGDLKRGHDALDAWVVAKRKEIAQHMLKLPGPKKK